MNRFLAQPLVGWIAMILLVGALSLAVYVVLTSKDTAVHKAFDAYAEKLEKLCRLQYLKATGQDIAKKQALFVLGAFVLYLLMGEELLLPVIFIGVIGPYFKLNSDLTKRREQLDFQLDGFLTTLANSLKVSPSLGDALASTANLVRSPLKEDLEFALKEYQLGTPLDQALLNMIARIDSRTFNSALSTILIGRQTGGDLPKILERAAATLREMARLEGVVRSKTAEGKSQAFVLGVVPFAIVLVISYVDPQWFRPLTSGNFIGYIVIAGSTAFWLAGIVAARRILNVDI